MFLAIKISRPKRHCRSRPPPQSDIRDDKNICCLTHHIFCTNIISLSSFLGTKIFLSNETSLDVLNVYKYIYIHPFTKTLLFQKYISIFYILFIERLAPVGCPDSGSADFCLYLFVHPTLSLELWKYHFYNMVIFYGRSFLLCARYWWKDLARNIKPVVPTQWNELKANGFLRSYRGKHSGAHSKLRENHGESNATFVPNYFKSKADVETAKKHTQRELMVSLLNMKNDTSASLPTNEPHSVTCSQGNKGFAFKHHVTGPKARRNWCYHKYYWCRYVSSPKQG